MSEPGPGPAPPDLAPAPAPRRLHPASPVLDLIVSARQFAFPLLVLAFGSARSLVLGPLLLVALAALVGWKVLAWSRFTYVLDGDVLTIEHGVLQRSRRQVPVSRVQQVDLRRRLRHRVLGVAVVQIDTAGGGSGAEVTLEAIADDEALALRGALLRRAQAVGAPAAPPGGDPGDGSLPAAGPVPAGPAAVAPVVVAELGTRELAVAGVTGSRLTTGLALGGAIYGLFVQLPAGLSDEVGDRLPSGAAALLAGAVAALPVLLLLAVASSVMTDHGYLLVRIGSDLHLRRGLFDQREATLSLHRVQVVRVHENLVRRALGLASVQLQSAGSGTASEGAVSRLTIPHVRRDRLDALLAEVLPAATHHPDLVPAPPAARRRVWVRALVPVLVLTVVVLALTGEPAALLLLLLAAPAGAVAELAYRGLGHVGTPTLVVARSGGLVRQTSLVPVAKTQSTRLTTSPFQRRLALASLHLDVAGRGETPVIHDGDAARLVALRHQALSAPAARDDEVAVRHRTTASAVAAAPVGALGGAD